MNVRPQKNHYICLDGLRGIMAIGVVAAHVKLEWLPGAHVFMEIFFVISAFLITTTLRKGIEKHREIQLIIFWKRRLLRLYPALLTVVVSYTVVAFFIVDDMSHILKDGLATLLYVSNFTKLSDYTLPHFFGQSWSLSLEEQFYLAWPLLLVLLLRYERLWRLRIPILVSMIVASILWRLYLVDSDVQWSRLYFGSDTRIDAFVVGGLLAFYREDLMALANKSKLFLFVLHIATLGVFCAVAFWDPKVNYYFIWQQPVVLLMTCLMVILLTREEPTPVQHLFTNKILIWLGVRCYGIYLWHWSLIWLILVHTDVERGPVLALIAVPTTLVLTWATFKYIEEPILKLRPAFKKRPSDEANNAPVAS